MKAVGIALGIFVFLFGAVAHGNNINPRPEEGEVQLLKGWTAQVFQIRSRWNTLTPEERLGYAPYYIPQPISNTNKLSQYYLFAEDINTPISNANIIHTEHFRIIWGISYQSYVNKGSENYWLWGKGSSGNPKFIEYLIEICEEVWGKVVDEFGFSPPYGAPDHYIDVYVANTGVINPSQDLQIFVDESAKIIKLPTYVYGVTTTYQNGIPFIIINQDLSINKLKVTFAHEFFHTVQIAYIGYDELLNTSLQWLAESTAVWMEDAVYPNINNYTQYVNYWVQYPDVYLFDPDWSYMQYGAVLFMKYLSEYYSQEGDTLGLVPIRTIWENAKVLKDEKEAISQFLKAQDVRPIKDLKSAYIEFALKNLDMKGSYKDGHLYKPVYTVTTIEANVPSPSLASFNMDAYGYMPSVYGASYVEIKVSKGSQYEMGNRLWLSFNGSQGYYTKATADWKFYVVFEDKNGNRTDPLLGTFLDQAKGEFYKIDPSVYTKCYVVIIALPLEELELENYKYKGFSFNLMDKFGYSLALKGYVTTYIGNGWNLVSPQGGFNPYSFQGKEGIVSMWKWRQVDGKWEVLLPNMDEGLFETYLSTKQFKELQGIDDGDGVWFNAKEGMELGDLPLSSQSITINQGWNLFGVRVLKDLEVPKAMEACLDSIQSVWKWVGTSKKWAVFIPSYGSGLAAYLEEKGFSSLTRLYYGEGFWVRGGAQCALALN